MRVFRSSWGARYFELWAHNCSDSLHSRRVLRNLANKLLIVHQRVKVRTRDQDAAGSHLAPLPSDPLCSTIPTSLLERQPLKHRNISTLMEPFATKPFETSKHESKPCTSWTQISAILSITLGTKMRIWHGPWGDGMPLVVPNKPAAWVNLGGPGGEVSSLWLYLRQSTFWQTHLHSIRMRTCYQDHNLASRSKLRTMAESGSNDGIWWNVYNLGLSWLSWFFHQLLLRFCWFLQGYLWNDRSNCNFSGD